MAINKKLIHFTNKVNFLNEYNKGNILPTSIVFIQDAKQIWTHDEFYSCPFTEEEINQLLVGSNIKLNGYTEITSPIEISATDTVNQAFGKIEDYLNSILELNAVLVDTGDAVYESPMINDYITANTFSSTLLNYVSDSELASKNYATKQDVADLVDGAPETLNTLNELAAALKDNSNIVDILNESISNKLSKTEAAENYQVKGDYITKTEVANSYLVKGNYVEEDIYDGVYAVDANGQLIDYNTADSSCLGVALVKGEHKFMIAKSDATDGTNTTLYWGKNLYSKDVAGVVTNGKVDGTNSSGYLPKPDGTFGGSTHLSDDFTTWTNGALSDFNGKANTAAIIAGYTEHGVSMDARDMCTVLDTFNASDSHNDWYVPALGQLALMYLNKTEINAALAKIGGTALAAERYWSSSERTSFYAWYVSFSSGFVDNSTKDNNLRVRFVRDISVSKPLKERVLDLENNKADKSDVEVEVEVEVENGVYAITADGKLIDYNLADATATGVALVAGEHKFMIAKSDATDGTNTTLYWGKNLYGKDVAGVVTNSKSDGTNGSGYLPKPDGSYRSTPNLSGDFTTWKAGALAEFNGAANTAAIIAGYTEHAVSMDARDMCTVLNTFNAADNFKDWYIPACGQLALMYLAKTDINAALAKIGGTAFNESDSYWSSSEYDANHAWFVFFLDGSVHNFRNKDSIYRVRFVRDLTTIKKPLKEKVSELELNYFKWSKLILPSFTIAGVSYDFEEGMTWEDWVNSEYNTNGAFVFRDDSGKIQAIYGGPYTSIVFNGSESESESEMVLPADIIISGHNYIAYDPAVE